MKKLVIEGEVEHKFYIDEFELKDDKGTTWNLCGLINDMVLEECYSVKKRLKITITIEEMIDE